jgi:hypothetical protein
VVPRRGVCGSAIEGVEPAFDLIEAGLEETLMADGQHCPACARDVGIWSVFSAGLPNLIWCPHCTARLGYRGTLGMCVVLTFATVAVIGGAFYTAASIPGLTFRVWVAVFAGLAFAAWVPVDLVVVWYLRRNCELVWLNKPKLGSDETLS